MNRKSGRVPAALLGLLACLCGLAACQTRTTEPEPTKTEPAPMEQAAQEEKTLVVAQSPFAEQFSPFYANTAADADAANLTQIQMLTTDRLGVVVKRAIEGETIAYRGRSYRYTGPCDIRTQYDASTDVTTYTIQLANDLSFSDGEPVGADDIVFTYYVFADPSYDGPVSLDSCGILGYKSYRSQIAEEIDARYGDLAAAIRAAGAEHVWTATNAWTQEQQAAYWRLEKAAWMGDLQDIVDLAKTNYAAFVTDIGKTEADLAASDKLDVALGMYAWSFAIPDGDGSLVGSSTGASWDLVASFPTMEDFYTEAYAAYSGDPETFFAVEAVDTSAVSTVEQARTDFIREQAQADPAAAGGVPNIEGIRKTGPYTVEIQTKGYDAAAIHTVCGLPIAPLHYYGDKAQYDYVNNRFGHPLGDLSLVREKSAQPMGAGPYRFVNYENGVCSFEANERYYKGEPKTKFVQLRETTDSGFLSDLVSGAVDVGFVEGSKANFEQIARANGNGALSGGTIAARKVDSSDFGYIGLSAKNIRVGDDSASARSRALRKAIATVLAVYRDAAYESYFGEAAVVVNYPISNSSWAAPVPGDDGYRTAFSLDRGGAELYGAGMTQEEKYAAAMQAAVGYFQDAGFLFDETTGRLTKAPEGAKLYYEAAICDNRTGEHPSFAVLKSAAEALSAIGFQINIRSLSGAAALADLLGSGTQEIWCADQATSIDPDFSAIYRSSEIAGKGNSDANSFYVNDAALDLLLLDEQKSDDMSDRKEACRSILDQIADWAVIVPAYQRQNAVVFSAERVKTDSIAADYTALWNWWQEIEQIEMQ